MENVNFISGGESENEPFWGFQIISLKISISSQSLLVGDKGFFECDMSPPALTGLHVFQEGELESVQRRMVQLVKVLKWCCGKESLKKWTI